MLNEGMKVKTRNIIKAYALKHILFAPAFSIRRRFLHRRCIGRKQEQVYSLKFKELIIIID